MIYLSVMVFFGILFIGLFIITLLSLQDKMPYSDKIMKIFKIQLFDDPIKASPKVSLLIMTITASIYLILEIFDKL